MDGTLYRSSFLRLLLRSIVSDNCIHVSCDEKLSKIVAGVNSQKKLRESRYRPFLNPYLITANPNLQVVYAEMSVIRAHKVAKSRKRGIIEAGFFVDFRWKSHQYDIRKYVLKGTRTMG